MPVKVEFENEVYNDKVIIHNGDARNLDFDTIVIINVIFAFPPRTGIINSS